MADPLNRVVSSDDLQSLTARGMSDVETFWTDAEMARAEPVEMRFPEPPIQPLKKALWQQPGPLTMMESQAPDDGVLDSFLESLPLGDGFSTSPVQDRTVLPYKTVGKIFMQFDGANFVGTGWVISERAVFTAGHCVYDKNSQGGWADRILFVPQYHNGQAPVGRWTAERIWTLDGWSSQHDYKYDLAVFLVDRPIRPRTGALGWIANAPPNQGPYTAIGYPAAPVPGYNFNGAEMWQSRGKYIDGNNPVQMHNNMTGGCSGGPWVIQRSNAVYANGINSFRYTSSPDTMYSPYFGEGFLSLYDKVKDA